MKAFKISKSIFIVIIVLTVAIAFSTRPCTAAPKDKPVPTECSLIGTWSGGEAGDMYWMGVHTAGATDNRGGMLMNWIYINPNLLNGATHLAPGHGVWEMTAEGQYNYAWYAYGIGHLAPEQPIEPIYTVRVIGTATMVDCDTVDISYIYEVFDVIWPPQSVSGTPLYSTSGVAQETRIPLPVVTP